MKEKLQQLKETSENFWRQRSRKQKGLMVSSVVLFLIIVIGGMIFFSRTPMVQLYSGLSAEEAGQVKVELDTRGIEHEVRNGGTTIYVPEGQAEGLLVELAALGIPDSGQIDYGFFSANTSWGVTDNEFGMIKLDAMQSELGNLLSGFSGINQANVMINLPEESVFITEQTDSTSVAINLILEPGHQFNNEQVRALYHLVEKAVPNLTTDNIVIMDQYFNYYNLDNENINSTSDVFAQQQSIKKEIERDLQQRVQQMLSVMIGPEKVIATVTADLDFTQENRVEQLVEPVDEEAIEGIPVSLETIRESYEGEGALDEAAAGAGEEDIYNYPVGDNSGIGEYELEQDTINYEFNRIQREISESPYRLRDLGIQVAVDNTKATRDEEGNLELLTPEEQQQVQASVQSILDSIITTSIDGNIADINPAEKTSIVFQTFNGISRETDEGGFNLPIWAYVAIGVVLLALIAVIVILLVRKPKQSVVSEEAMYMSEEDRVTEIPDIEEPEDTESSIKRKQLEKMATEKPDDFAKLLRSWISED